MKAILGVNEDNYGTPRPNFEHFFSSFLNNYINELLTQLSSSVVVNHWKSSYESLIRRLTFRISPQFHLLISHVTSAQW